MHRAEVVYKGELRTEATHLRSENQLITDAPVDNNGKGEAFSPTDLVATGLLSCMITVMGIKAKKMGYDMGEVEGSVKKTMADAPRRICRLDVEINFKKNSLSLAERKILERTAIHCPVAMSIHPDISQNIKFNYS